MSRLHEILTERNAQGIKPSEPYTGKGGISARAGTRRTRTRSKTARSLGYDYTPTSGWRVRSQGLDSASIRKAKEIKGMRKQAIAVSKGDVKQP